MASFERLNVQRARRPSADGGEGSVWRRFRHPLTFRHKAAPTHVEFSPVAPHDFAVASSLQVDVFSTRTTAIYRSLTRFKDVVHCCSYRGDGKMLAAGDDAGTVQIFDLGSRAVMRTFRGHQRAVHVARFTPDGSNVFTASDDQRAICWDVAAETQVRRFDGHTDFVRCGALNPNSPKLLVTGSYDHTVRLWDVNSPKCIMELQHAAPVEVRAVAFAHGTPHTALLWARGLVCAPLLARVSPGPRASTRRRHARHRQRQHHVRLGHPQRWACASDGVCALQDDHLPLRRRLRLAPSVRFPRPHGQGLRAAPLQGAWATPRNGRARPALCLPRLHRHGPPRRWLGRSSTRRRCSALRFRRRRATLSWACPTTRCACAGRRRARGGWTQAGLRRARVAARRATCRTSDYRGKWPPTRLLLCLRTAAPTVTSSADGTTLLRHVLATPARLGKHASALTCTCCKRGTACCCTALPQFKHSRSPPQHPPLPSPCCWQPGQMVVERTSANRLSAFDKALKSFKYHEAFDAALINGSPDIVVAVIEELVQRNGLRIALQGRDQHTLEPVVAFLVRQITAPPFAAVLIGVANLLLDMYAPVLGKSAAIDELFVKLRNTLEAEMRLQARTCPRCSRASQLPIPQLRFCASARTISHPRRPALGLAGRVVAANGRDGRAPRRSHAHRRREAAASTGHPPARPRGFRLPARRRCRDGYRKVRVESRGAGTRYRYRGVPYACHRVQGCASFRRSSSVQDATRESPVGAKLYAPCTSFPCLALALVSCHVSRVTTHVHSDQCVAVWFCAVRVFFILL